MSDHRQVWHYDSGKKAREDIPLFDKHDDIDCVVTLMDDDRTMRFCKFAARGPMLIGCRCKCHDYIRYHQKEDYYYEMLYGDQFYA